MTLPAIPNGQSDEDTIAHIIGWMEEYERGLPLPSDCESIEELAELAAVSAECVARLIRWAYDLDAAEVDKA